MNISISQKVSQKAFKMKIILELMALSPEERSSRINELVEIELDIPYSKKKYISRSTIYSWIKEYETAQNRDKVLFRKERTDKGEWRRLSEEQKTALIRWRYDNAYRTCEDLREELIANNLASEIDAPSVSVIGRFLRNHSLDRKTLTRNNFDNNKIRMSFEADYPNQLWMIDTKGPNIKIPSLNDPSRLVCAMPIVALDDFSRYVTGIKYITEGNEKEETVMELLMESFDKYGIPDILYTDRGSPYMGKALEKALNVLGCRVLHTRPRDCSAKGKVEKIMQLYYQKLDTELVAKKQTENLTLEKVNEYAAAITHSYHLSKHRETEAMPYERYLNYPGKFRHYSSKEILSLLFLPTTKSKVTKDNLILLNKRKYLIPVTGYDRKCVEIRYRISQPEIVFVWHDNKFLGIAEEYTAKNDYIDRQKYIYQDTKNTHTDIPAMSEVPEYNRLERKLMEYRKINENCENINTEIRKLKEQRAQTKSQFTLSSNDDKRILSNSEKGNVPAATANNIPAQNIHNNIVTNGSTMENSNDNWTADNCIHLLSSLFRRSLSSQERFAIHRVFNQYGPLEEKMIRRVVGRLLGESYPTNDLNGYLDAIRIESMLKREAHSHEKNK